MVAPGAEEGKAAPKEATPPQNGKGSELSAAPASCNFRLLLRSYWADADVVVSEWWWLAHEDGPAPKLEHHDAPCSFLNLLSSIDR